MTRCSKWNYRILANGLLTIVLTFTSLSSVQGQTETEIQTEKLVYHASYFGNNLWNGGLKLGVEIPKRSFTQPNKKGKTQTIRNSYLGDLGYYWHNNNHIGVFINAGWQRKKIFPNRLFWTAAANPLGLYRSFLPKTYRVNDAGNVQQVFLPGRTYLAPSVSLGIGRVRKKRPDQGVFAKVNIITLLPYNTYLMPLLNIEFGYHFSFKSTDK